MGTAIRTAGVAGTVEYRTSVIPFEAPLITIYSDPSRTTVAHPEQTSQATANPAIFLFDYPATLAAGTYYVGVRVRLFDGQPLVADNNDLLILEVFTGEVQGLLVDVATYRTATLDTTSGDAAVTGALVEAQELISEYLRRPLVLEERTEYLEIHNIHGESRVYPSATPVVSAPTGMTVSPRGQWITGASPDEGQVFNDPQYATVTYHGGWSSGTVPQTIKREIMFAAWAILHDSNPATVPAGATSVRLGDAAVTYGSGGADSVAVLAAASKARLRPYRRR